jgi:hypothetical protein
MPDPSDNSHSHEYEMPPTLIHSLVYGTTWALYCPACERQIAVDVIRLVESVADVRDFKSEAMLRRATCKDCGGRLKHTGGYTVHSLKHTGHMPKLITTDGSNWRRPVWQSLSR